MRLTAQRVRSWQTAAVGINAFFYTHGGYTWHLDVPREVWPENDSGELVRQNISIPPPGNHVLSYLDLVAPDERSDMWLAQQVQRCASNAELYVLPWNVITPDGLLCRFHLEQARLSRWQQELSELFRAALLVRRST